MLARALVALATGTTLAVAAPAAHAQSGQGEGLTQPAYPGNTISIEPLKELVAGTLVKVRLTGQAQWNTPETTPTTAGYGLSLFAQNAALDPQCSPSLSQQRQKSVNADVSASASGTGFVMTDGITVNPTPPSNVQPYAFDSVPFVIRPGLRDIVLCAYSRYVIDDAAVYALPVKVTQPRCRLSRSAVRRGTAVTLTCNAAGKVVTRFRRDGRSRSQTVTVGNSGKARLSTRSLARGTHSVSFRIGELTMGTGRLRVA